MLKSYFLTAWRSLLKNRTFSFINILGLTLGTLSCLYILLYVSDQYSYDRHHTDAGDIYRVICHYKVKTKGTNEDVATTAAQTAPMMKQDFADVVQFTRVIPFAGVEQQLLQYNNKTLYEKDAVYVDSTFFDVFNYHFVSGNAREALQEPFSVVLLKSTADKLFGREDPIGKTFVMENSADSTASYTVRGVVDESLGKSHLHANIFVTMNSGNMGRYMMYNTSWTSNTYASSYVKLRHGAAPRVLETKLPVFVDHYAGEQFKKSGLEMQLKLQPVADIHTTPGLIGIQLDKAVNPSFLNVLLLVAVLIQIIACINFMNLSTARASRRAKEVGVRKVIGAGRMDLVKQFLGESFLITLISVAIAVPLLMMALPLFNQITHASVGISSLDKRTVLGLCGLVFLTALIAGSYPAFYLSAFKAIRVIKGNFTSHISASGIRRGLVVFQFILSTVLVSGIVVIYCQLNYIKNKDLGFEKDQKLTLSFYTQDDMANIPALMNDLWMLPEVKAVSNASRHLGSPLYFRNSFFLQGQKESEQKGMDYIISDQFFIRANGIKLISGRDFRATDSSKILINESYARQMGLDPLHAAGTVLYDKLQRQAEIVGVMKDFNYGSLHENIKGFALWKRGPHDAPWPTLTVNTHTADYKALLSKIAAIWHRDVPDAPFSYAFLDEMVQQRYETEIAMSHIIDTFTIMALIISCLGLFGLAAFSAEQRRKEISIRKVLGASVASITRMLSGDFIRLVLAAFVIAVPIAWWMMNKWLEGFAYRTTISWWMFGIAGVISVLIAAVTVSFQAIRAAMANPARSLRAE
ncbi:MAG: ABC transporter permease [Chitinophagaceae bacterium]|nr:ABC transporter permease [Chitinophagaceae bacterium]